MGRFYALGWVLGFGVWFCWGLWCGFGFCSRCRVDIIEGIVYTWVPCGCASLGFWVLVRGLG